MIEHAIFALDQMENYSVLLAKLNFLIGQCCIFTRTALKWATFLATASNSKNGSILVKQWSNILKSLQCVIDVKLLEQRLNAQTAAKCIMDISVQLFTWFILGLRCINASNVEISTTMLTWRIVSNLISRNWN